MNILVHLVKFTGILLVFDLMLIINLMIFALGMLDETQFENNCYDNSYILK